MNGLINWLNKHVVPIAARIGSIRWLVALRDAFIAIMPAMMAGAVSTVLNALTQCSGLSALTLLSGPEP